MVLKGDIGRIHRRMVILKDDLLPSRHLILNSKNERGWDERKVMEIEEGECRMKERCTERGKLLVEQERVEVTLFLSGVR
jgi:hypothetical protein